MKVTFTKAGMLERRRLVGGLEPLRADCSIVHTDGVDLDAVLEHQLRCWYLDLLDNAPPAMLALKNISKECAVGFALADEYGASPVSVPATCRRVFEIMLQGWAVSAPVLPPEERNRVIARQRNPYTAATAKRPVALRTDGGSILAWPAGQSVLSLIAATDTGPDSYVFDESALATIPTTL